jgi:tRNA pseudouridine55 synthase
MTQTPNHACEGIFALDKPRNMSSQQAVGIVKRWAKQCSGQKNIRVGHAGTLDPLASGVLVIAVGRTYTRQLDDIVQKEKAYDAEVTLGITTTTDDAEGEQTQHTVEQPPTHAAVEHALQAFIGDIQQTPPRYSAAKISGEEGYKRARRGEVFDPGAHSVFVKDLVIAEYAYPKVCLRVTTGPGVYIRSLARDLGEALGTGGYLSSLRRTSVGQFDLSDARAIGDFT